MSTMEDIFDNDGPVEKEPEPAPEPVEVKEEDKVELKDDESQTETEDVTGEKEEPDESPLSESTVPITALHGERDRRQAAETELEALKAKLQPDQEDEPLTSVFDNEEGFVSGLEQKFNQALVNRTLNESQFHAEQKFGADVIAQKVETFKQLVVDNPQYAQQFANSVSPYFTLVDLVDKHQEFDAMKDIDGYKAKLKEEVRQQVLKELESEKESDEKLKRSIPDSLAGDDSKGGIKSTTWSGPASAESIFDEG